MRPSRVVASAPLLDDHLGFPEAVEDLATEAFIGEYAIEGRTGAIRQRRPIHVTIDRVTGDREPERLGSGRSTTEPRPRGNGEEQCWGGAARGCGCPLHPTPNFNKAEEGQ